MIIKWDFTVMLIGVKNAIQNMHLLILFILIHLSSKHLDIDKTCTIKLMILEARYYAAINKFLFEQFTNKKITSGLFVWEGSKTKVTTFAVRNRLFMVLMPTAGTSQICGNSHCFEPITSNIFTARLLLENFNSFASF